MQSSDEVDNIVKNKIRQTSNQKTLDDMQNAINEIEQESKTDRTYAVVGFILIIVSLYFSYQYFFT